jgi:hypothetical protein
MYHQVRTSTDRAPVTGYSPVFQGPVLLPQGSESLAPLTDSSLGWDAETGWVQLKTHNALQGNRTVPLCWLPVERRGDRFAVHDHTLVIGAKTGVITILDFISILAKAHDTNTS